MTDVDLPQLDETIKQLPSDIRSDLAERGRSSLFFMTKAVLGYNRVNSHTHGGMCEFHDRNPAKYKMTLMPRGTYKSTVKTVSGGLQAICKDPEQRVLITNENDGNAQRFLYSIKTHAESNKIFRTLYSDLIPKNVREVRWNNEVLDFNRKGHYPEASITGRGITSALTSQHYTHMILDDLISIEAVKSPAVMQDTIMRAHQVLSLAVDPKTSTWDLVGTRWAFADLYSDFEKKYGTSGNFAKYIRAANEDGELLFPEILGVEELAQLRASYGPYLYSCLYQNNPRNEEVQDFNIQDLRFWKWAADEEHITLYGASGEIKEFIRASELDVYITLDLAAAEKVTSDRNAAVTTGVTAYGDVVVLDVFAQRCSPITLMNYLIAQAQRWPQLRVLGIEDIAYQKAFKYFLKAETERRGIYIHVKPLKAQGKKEVRIRGLQPVAATGHLYVLPAQHILRDEMADFPLGAHDDVLDALAMGLQVWPQRVSAAYWEKYKASEDALLKRIDGYGLRPQPLIDPGEEDPEDASYSFAKPTWQDHQIPASANLQ
jgi:predicted phage terminase large subunit-like protein